MSDVPEWVQEEIDRVRRENLTELNLQLQWNDERPSLNRIPNEIFQLKQLQILNLRGHKLTQISEGLRKLTRLTHLFIDGVYDTIPNWIGELESLTSLSLTGQNSRVPLAADESIGWSTGNYRNIPNSLSNLTGLTQLSLSGQFDKIPSWLSKFTHLRELSLIGTYKEIPETVSNLTHLTNLRLIGRYPIFPTWIFQLSSLNVLYLCGDFHQIPAVISNFRKLEVLGIGGDFRAVPESIGDLQNLIQLSLLGQLSAIPEWVFQLGKLEILDLVTSKIRIIPHDITKLSRLKILWLDYDYLETPPPEIAKDGNYRTVNLDAIRNYYQSLEQEDEDHLYEAKLLVLGEGGAGKTSLARKILDPDYQLVPNEKSTEGIDVMRWEFPFDHQHQFRVNIWDFGGQEIYHATHQFFLTNRSVYALVADSRKEDTDFNYWLNVVQLLGGDSPILIVNNEKQDRQRQIAENQLRARYGNIVDILHTNLETNRNLDSVLQEIVHQMHKLPHVGTPLPRSWVEVRRMLEHDDRNYIELNEYYSMCELCNLGDRAKQDLVIGYLHDLGVCLHFKNDPVLKRYIILKPDWGTSAVYAVLDNKQVIDNLGLFTRDQLDDIWSDPSFDGMHDELLQLMMRFKLCYEIPAKPHTYIAPQLLSENQPKYEWDATDNRFLRYKYGFMPKGLVTRLIVAMHRRILGNLVWKTGVVLKRYSARAEVTEHYQDNQIHIRITGTDKKALLDIVMEELDKIHATYSGLQVDKLIPCNCETCVNSSVPHFFSYDVMQRSLAKTGQVLCEQSFELLDTRRLLDDALPQAKDRRQFDRSNSSVFIGHIDQFVQGVEEVSLKKQMISGGQASMDENQNKSEIQGNIQAGNVAINSKQKFGDNATITINIGALQGAADGSPQAELRKLLEQLETQLMSLPAEQAEDAELIREYANTAVEETVKETPNPKKLKITGDGLKAAAQNLLAVAPIAVQIAEVLLRIR